MRKIGADNQHDDTHCAHQHQESWTHLPAHVLFQRNQPRVDRIPVRMLALQLFRQDGELSLSTLDGYAGLQPSDDRHRVSGGFRIVRERPGNKDIDRRARGKDAGEVERRGQDTDDRYRLIVQRQLLSHHVRVRSKPSAPKAVTQQHGGRRGILAFGTPPW